MTTYNILIVDDEPLLRANLKIYINNLKKNYTIIGDAANGEEAIQILNTKKVHIILSDVMMPIMNGVELSSYVNSHFPHIPLVMLSNYDDFTYVKTTLKNGARDYLLKHTLNENVLGECLATISKDLDTEGSISNQEIKYNLPQLQHQFILRLLEDTDHEISNLVNELNILDFPIGKSNIIVSALDIDDFAQFSESAPVARKKAVESSIITLVNQLSENHMPIYITHLERGRYLILSSFVNMHSAANINSQLMEFLQSIKSNLNRFLNLSVTISYSYICRDISHIANAYETVDNAIKQKFVSGKNKIYDHVALETGDQELIWIDSDVKQGLVTELNYGDLDELSKILKQIFLDLKTKQVRYSQCHLLLYDLLNIVSQSCNSNSISPSEFYEAYDITSLNLRIFDTLDDIEIFITKLFLKLYNRINTGISNDYSDLTKRAITYIKNNYSDPFSLSETAEHLNVNKSYLSNLFKGEVGIGFNKYLTQLRIENAKNQMINSKDSTATPDLETISVNCGFNSYSYFSTTFKKIEGISPGQFLKKNR